MICATASQIGTEACLSEVIFGHFYPKMYKFTSKGNIKKRYVETYVIFGLKMVLMSLTLNSIEKIEGSMGPVLRQSFVNMTLAREIPIILACIFSPIFVAMDPTSYDVLLMSFQNCVLTRQDIQHAFQMKTALKINDKHSFSCISYAKKNFKNRQKNDIFLG